MDIGTLIFTKRKEKGYSQKELADKVGVSEATISRWESGEIKNMKRKMWVCLQTPWAFLPSYLWNGLKILLQISKAKKIWTTCRH